MRHILLVCLLVSINGWCDSNVKMPVGVWQSSYAFLGKIPWDKGYLEITEEKIRIKNGKEVSESYSYEVIGSDGSGLFAKLSNSKLWKIVLNPKFGCKPKNRYSYDRACTQHDQRQKFKLLICKSVSTCKPRNTFYTFEKRELVKLGNNL